MRTTITAAARERRGCCVGDGVWVWVWCSCRVVTLACAGWSRWRLFWRSPRAA